MEDESLMLLKNKNLMLLQVKNFRFKNNTLNGDMLNIKQKTTQHDLCFSLIFLTRSFDNKLQSLLRVYQF